jgi:ABC-type phosphate/phosphonate transport system permease subunit
LTLALLLLALGTYLLRLFPWRWGRRLGVGQVGPSLVVALFLVSAFSPPPSPEWARVALGLFGVYAAARATGHLGAAILLGVALYTLLSLGG